MKQYCLSIIGILLCTQGYTQFINLVPNPSFENYVQCPYTTSQLSYTQDWYNPTSGTPDYFRDCDTSSSLVDVPNNTCGYEPARTGNSYAGVFAYNGTLREYIQIRLSSPMIAGHRYYVEYFVNLVDYAKYSISSMGAHLSVNPITGVWNLYSYMPQIINPATVQLNSKVGWTMIADTIVAVGGEEYLTLGNFNTSANSDTVFVGSSSTGWFVSYYYIDDVSVYDLDNPLLVSNEENVSDISIYPNPCATGEFNVSYFLKSDGELVIYNSTGQLISSSLLSSGSGIQGLTLSNYSTGIYRFQLISCGLPIKTGSIIVTD